MALPILLKALRISIVAALAGPICACSTLESFLPGQESGPSGARPITQSATPASDQAKVLPLGAQDIDCPGVEVQDGTAALRVGGQSNESVRYQFDITETARECRPTGLMLGTPGAQF